MNMKNTNSLFDVFNENFNRFFDKFFTPLRVRANLLSLQNSVEPIDEDKTNTEMREIYYTHFFKDIVGWCKQFNLYSGELPVDLEQFPENFAASFFENEEMVTNESSVESIIYKVFSDYTDIAFKLVVPLQSLIETQNELIESFIKQIYEKNSEVQNQIENNSKNLAFNYFRETNPKISEIDDENFIMISRSIKQSVLKKKDKIGQEDYAEGMGKYFKAASRISLVKEVEKRFPSKKYQDWIDEL